MVWTFAPALCLGAELDFFRLTGLGGSLELDYTVKDLETERVNRPTSTQHHPISKQKLKLESTGYIYHPNLVDMELGLGIEFRQDEYEDDSVVTNESKQKLYSFDGRFDILKEKPYPLKLHFNHYNPTITTGLADTVTTENTNYGMLLSLREPLVSFPIWLRADHAQTKGDGGGATIDSDYDYQQLSISSRGLDNVRLSASFDHSRKRSSSGSVNLPIMPTLSETYGLLLRSAVLFGEEGKNTFVNRLNYDIEEFKGISKSKSGEFDTYLTLQHGGDFQSNYKYSISNTINDESDYESTHETLDIGLSGSIIESMKFNSNLIATDDESEGYNTRTYGTKNDLLYSMDLTENLSFSTTYSLQYDNYDQSSDTRQLSITGETHLLDSLQPVLLSRDYILLESVVVSNPDRTQIYLEGLDYRLTVVGEETRLERLLTGNIPDGESVLIDYDYETGGTYAYTVLGQGLSFGFSVFKTYRFRMGYSKSDPTLKEGRPLKPLYSRERSYAAAESRHLLSRTMVFSWHIGVEKQTDELRPYVRKDADISYRFRLPFVKGSARLYSRYEQTDNKLSEEDVMLTQHGLDMTFRTGRRSGVIIRYSTDKDTGGTMTRERRRALLDYKWRWRLLSFSLRGKYDLDEQDDASKKDSSIELTLTRLF